MNANNIITKCDRLKPNNYPYSQKMEWLSEIESDIISYINMYSKNTVASDFDNSQNPVLVLPKADSNIYLFYLISMIDLANQEYDLYNNSTTFFNYELNSWKRKIRRKKTPECNISIKV
ncbi:MAG: hypothetical protein II998_02735 [Clostridia bacterium]|nr:hypothetical protein [Clostridia bacterium]